MITAANFLEQTIKQYPFKITKILTDNGMEFCYNALVKEKKPKKKVHLFMAVCINNNIEHRTTLVKLPWTNGMVEAMNKKIKTNTTKKFHYDTIVRFKEHLYYYTINYNFKLKLKGLNYKSPFEKTMQLYKEKTKDFNRNPQYLIVGLNTM